MATATDVRMSAYELLDELANGDGGAWLHVEADSITSFWVEANNGFSPDEILSLALDGYQVDDPPGWDRAAVPEGWSINQDGPGYLATVPNMYRPPVSVGQQADRKMYEGRRPPLVNEERMAKAAARDARLLESGDLVQWGTGSRGRVIRIDQRLVGQRYASIAVEGWYMRGNHWTRKDTGVPGCLRIAIEDLTLIRGEGA